MRSAILKLGFCVCFGAQLAHAGEHDRSTLHASAPSDASTVSAGVNETGNTRVAWADSSLLVVSVSGAESGDGQFIVSLFDNARGFPKRPVTRRYVPASDTGIATVRFAGLVPGDYAVTVVHDEDMNGRLNRNFLGVPKESFGLSNNVRPGLSRPSWGDAKFRVAVPMTQIDIAVGAYSFRTSQN